MKLKRTKLAALALTALMAAGATSLVAYATEEIIATEQTIVSDGAGAVATGDVIEATETSVVFKENSDGSYTAYLRVSDPTDSTKYTDTALSATVTRTVTQAATCKAEGIFKLTVTVDGTEYTGLGTIAKTTDHTYTEVSDVTTTATHISEGLTTIYYQCSVCGANASATEITAVYGAASNYTGADYDNGIVRTVTTAKLSHIASTTVTYMTIYNALNAYSTSDDYSESEMQTASNLLSTGNDGNVTISGSTVTVVDSTENAYYFKVTTCTSNDGYIYELVKIEGTSPTMAYATINYVSNISYYTYTNSSGKSVRGYESTYLTLSQLAALTNTSFTLTDCSKVGEYTVTYYDSDMNVTATTTTKTVAAHHTEVIKVEFASASDAALCTVTYATDGTPTVTCNVCSKSVTYYVVTYCTNGCTTTSKPATTGRVNADGTTSVYGTTGYTFIEETKATAEASATSHTIDTTTEAEINKLVKKGTTYAELDGYKTDYVVFSNNTSTCLTAGTVDVTYKCLVCGAEVKTETLDVTFPGHSKAETATVDNEVAGTCESTGSYDAVYYCTNRDLYGCDYEYSRTTVVIPRTAHTNETGVADNGIGTPDYTDSLDAKNVEIQFVGGTIIVDDDGELLEAGVGAELDSPYLTVTLNSDGTYKVVYTSTGNLYLGSSALTESELTAILQYNFYTHIGDGGKSQLSLSAYAVAVSKCDVCGHEERMYVPVTVTIDSITKEKSNGEAGSITLTATYTNDNGTYTKTATFDYYSYYEAYLSRTETTPLNGLAEDTDGVWKYFVDDEVASTYTGFVEYEDGQFFVVEGILASWITGVAEYEGTFYYLSNGQVVDWVSTLVDYDGEWFYINKGVVDTSVNGLVDYDGGKFLIAAGRLVSEYSGLYYYSGSWYFLADGQVQSYTGVTYYDGAFFKLVDGLLDADYNGTIEYDGATFNVVAGQLYEQVA